MPSRSNIDVRKIASQQIENASPGTVLRDALSSQGVGVVDAAKRLKTSQPTLSLILADKREISKDMALRIEAAFGVPAYVLARLRFEASFAHAQAASTHAKPTE